jgi:hypothetical protein
MRRQSRIQVVRWRACAARVDALVLALVLATTPMLASHVVAQEGEVAGDPVSAPLVHPPVPDQAALDAMRASAPTDPFDAAAYLVDQIGGGDLGRAAAAVGEILRRSGIPVVSSDGPVLAWPDHLVLTDLPVYAEWTADLAREVIHEEAWTLAAFVDGLKGIELIDEQADPADVGAGLATWGKDPEDPVESVFAGAVLRALGGRRGQVMVPGLDAELLAIDTLAGTLVLAHALGDADERTPLAAHLATRRPGRALGVAPGERGLVQALALARSDPCAALADGVRSRTGQAGKDILKDKVKDAIKRRAPSAVRDRVGTLIDVSDKALDVVSLLLLLAGTEFELVADKPATHYKHAGGSRREHVKLKAKATFDSALAQKNLACYRLAGIKVPPNGPIAGFKVAWMLTQALGSYSRFGTGMNPFPLFQQGKHLTVVRADRWKVCDRLSCGETTGSDGMSQLELYPPVEMKPNKGAHLYGKVGVKASLSQDDVPSLVKVTDPRSLIKRGAGGLPTGQAAWAIKKIVDLAISYLKRAGLPNRSLTINVGYHGNDVYVVKGSGTAFLFWYSAPFKIDLYTCEGLREGVWKGEAEFKGIRNFLGDAAKAIFRVNLRGRVVDRNPNVNQPLNLLDQSGFPWVTPIDPYLNAWFEVTRRPREETVMLEGGPRLIAEHLDGTVGDVQLYVGDTSLDVAMETFGLGTANFPIVGRPDDPRCEGPGPDDYFFEDV